MTPITPTKNLLLEMDLLRVTRGLNFVKKRKKWVFLLGFLGFSSYGVYKLYNSPCLIRKRKRVLGLFRVLFSVVEMASDSAETFGLVCRDLNEFLRSDSDEIPNSLKQICKIATCDEFNESVKRVSEALFVGVFRGYCRESSDQSGVGESTGFADRVIDKMLSNSGSGFASVVAGSFARNLVLGFYSGGDSVGVGGGGEFSSVPKWVDLIFEDKCKELIANCIQVFVSKAVEVYLEKTMHINTYDEFFAGLTNPNHETKVQELIVCVCNGAVETLIKTSHQVLTAKTGNSDLSSSSSPTDVRECSNLKGGDYSGSKQLINEGQTGGWGGMVLSTLSVPRNQRFVFHVTGRVTFETFKSFVEFLLSKLSDGLRASGNIVNDHAVEKGRRVVRFFGLKSFVIACICLALYLRIICGTRSLLPA